VEIKLKTSFLLRRAYNDMLQKIQQISGLTDEMVKWFKEQKENNNE